MDTTALLHSQTPEETVFTGEQVVDELPEISLPISDTDYRRFVDQMEQKARAFWDKDFKLKERQDKMRSYWLGKQLEGVSFYKWQSEYVENIILRNTETHISNALGRLPDIIVIPGNKTPPSADLARELQQILEINVNDIDTRHILRMSARHLFLYLFGCIKYRWDKNIGPYGDYVFEWVHPDDLLFDHTAYLDSNPRFVIHYLEETIKEIQAKFPNKKAELWQKFNIKRGTENQLAKTIRYKETWFTWIDDEGKPLEGVGWSYENLVFKIMKNPNWDYEGEERETEELEADMETGGLVPTKEQYYHNHFEQQEKPFIILNFLNLGKHLIDDTSLVEQAILPQDNVNKRGRQITQAADTANGKWIFSSEFITRPEAEKVTDDPGEHIWGHGRIQDGAMRVAGRGPDATLFAAFQDNRQSLDNLFGTHPTLRGQKETDVATTSTILREGDVTRIDDFVKEALERAVNRMVNAATHMMKVNYTDVHYIKDAGTDGEFVFLEMSRDRIEDGVVVKVKASTADKRVRRAEAFEMAKARMIDPYTLYERTDQPNPKEMTKRLILFTANPMAYLQEIVGEGGTPGDLIKSLGQGGAGGGNSQAITDIQLLTQGQTPQPPEQITPEYLSAFSNFMESPDFQNLDQQTKTNFVNYINQVKETAKATIGGGGVPA